MYQCISLVLCCVQVLVIDKPMLGSVATNRFVYLKTLGGLGGSYPVPFPFWSLEILFPFDFGFCRWIFSQQNFWVRQPFRCQFVLSVMFTSHCRLGCACIVHLNSMFSLVYSVLVSMSCIVCLESLRSFYHLFPSSLGSQFLSPALCLPGSSFEVFRHFFWEFWALCVFSFAGGRFSLCFSFEISLHFYVHLTRGFRSDPFVAPDQLWKKRVERLFVVLCVS